MPPALENSVKDGNFDSSLTTRESNEELGENYDIFLSHASAGKGKVLPLPKEPEFVEALHKKLESGDYGYKVFFDKRDDPQFTREERDRALTNSCNLIMIWSPRYKYRYKDPDNDFGDIPEELGHFVKRARLTKIRCFIPVLYGIDEIGLNFGTSTFYDTKPIDLKLRIDETDAEFELKADVVALAAKEIKQRLNIIWSSFRAKTKYKTLRPELQSICSKFLCPEKQKSITT